MDYVSQNVYSIFNIMVSEFLSLLIFIILPVLVAFAGVWSTRKIFTHDLLKRHAEITAPIHAAISVVYAVLLAFVILSVWEQYNMAEDAVEKEANQIEALDRDIETFSEPAKSEIRAALQAYTLSIIEVEWNLMTTGKMEGHRNDRYEEIWDKLQSFDPKDERERIWLNTVYQQLNKLNEARSIRLLYAERSVQPQIWILLILCGLITILFSCFLSAEHKGLHYTLVSSLGVVIGVILLMIAEIDFPYQGLVCVDHEPYRHALETLQFTHKN